MSEIITSENEKPKYLRWHPAGGDATMTFRGDRLQSLNEGTMNLLHEQAIEEYKWVKVIRIGLAQLMGAPRTLRDKSQDVISEFEREYPF
jgi:hypothetical protein